MQALNIQNISFLSANQDFLMFLGLHIFSPSPSLTERSACLHQIALTEGAPPAGFRMTVLSQQKSGLPLHTAHWARNYVMFTIMTLSWFLSFARKCGFSPSMQRSKVRMQMSNITVGTRAGCPSHGRAIIWNIFQSVISTPARLHRRLQVTNTGLAEFTPDHAPSVQLVATLVMTSSLCAPIGPETLLTHPMACRWSDVSRDGPRSLSLEWAGLRDRRRQSEQDWCAVIGWSGESARLLLRENEEGERFARGTDASAAPHKS